MNKTFDQLRKWKRNNIKTFQMQENKNTYLLSTSVIGCHYTCIQLGASSKLKILNILKYQKGGSLTFNCLASFGFPWKSLLSSKWSGKSLKQQKMHKKPKHITWPRKLITQYKNIFLMWRLLAAIEQNHCYSGKLFIF